MKKILFISWDGPQTSYMEGLFIPIFEQLTVQAGYELHILQFTWAGKEKLEKIKEAAKSRGIVYISEQIKRKPLVILGTLQTIFKGSEIIKKYVENNAIDILMPRSTFPAMMVNRIKNLEYKLIFDADGLPIEERIDFGRLKRNSFMYKFLKRNETKTISRANAVLVRSKQAIGYHLENRTKQDAAKFFIVQNGRNPDFFCFDSEERIKKREEMSVGSGQLLAYCGSLDGNKYLFSEMLQIFRLYQKEHRKSKFLILSGNTEFQSKISPDLKGLVIFKTIPFQDVPKYLSAADVSLGIIQQAPSMRAVSAVKLGEYLLMGLPTIFSKNIGNSEEIINKAPNCFLYDQNDPQKFQKAFHFIESNENINHAEIRKIGLFYFSLQKSVESYLNALKTI